MALYKSSFRTVLSNFFKMLLTKTKVAVLNQPLLRLSHRARHGHLSLGSRRAVLKLKIVFVTHRYLELKS